MSAFATRCAIPDCGRDAYAKGWCAMHYQRAKRHNGNPLGGTDRTRKGTLPDGWHGRDKSKPTGRGAVEGSRLDVGEVRPNTPAEIAAARELLHRMAADDLIEALGLTDTDTTTSERTAA